MKKNIKKNSQNTFPEGFSKSKYKFKMSFIWKECSNHDYKHQITKKYFENGKILSNDNLSKSKTKWLSLSIKGQSIHYIMKVILLEIEERLELWNKRLKEVLRETI